MEPLTGIADADAHLGTRVPLPSGGIPLPRWVDVHADGPDAVEVAWNLDDSRDGAPGRLALRVGRTPAPARDLLAEAGTDDGFALRTAALPQAQPSLRPVTELSWELPGLHLRLTAQGPWRREDLLALARSVA